MNLRTITHAGFDNYRLRFWPDIDVVLTEDVTSASIVIGMTDRTTGERRAVRLTHDQLCGAQLSAVEEAGISLRARRNPPRDGGRLTQDDAIRGWL